MIIENVITKTPKIGLSDSDVSFIDAPLTQVWLLKLALFYLVPKSQVRKSVSRGKNQNLPSSAEMRHTCIETCYELAFLTGVKGPRKNDDPVKSILAIVRRIERQVSELEQEIKGRPWLESIPNVPRRNLISSGAVLGLSDFELRCLTFVVGLSVHENFRRLSSLLGGNLNNHDLASLFAAVLDIPFEAARAALHRQGRLMSSQLLTCKTSIQNLCDKFDWSSDSFRFSVVSDIEFDILNAVRDRIIQAPPATLKWEEHFKHLGKLHGWLFEYLQEALKTRRRGVNLLIWGKIGVGKSELTRALAQALNCELLEVAVADEDGDPIDGISRLRSLRLLEGVCADRRCMIVMDEAEDIWPAPQPFIMRKPSIKGWTNKILETNKVITLWLTNSVEAIDHAFLRRYDICLEVTTPSSKNRKDMLSNLPIGLNQSAIHRFAMNENLTPGILTRAASVVNTIEAHIPAEDRPEAFETIINQTLKAQGFSHVSNNLNITKVYDPKFINSDIDAVKLVEGIKRSSSAQILLYGPSGTGKSFYAQWVAQQLGQPAHLKKASDLLSKYVGESEKQIAAAFREAQEAQAVLILDEVDSFLTDRSTATRKHEVTGVNEFLVQMENYTGILICTTNMFHAMDSAAIRRLSLKSKLDYLRTEHLAELLALHLKTCGVPPASDKCLEELLQLKNLAPGDFSAVAKRHQFSPLPTAEEWVRVLSADSERKNGGTRRFIGFNPAS
jgi:transitional endoplasmic reticulum ATPase